MAATDWGRWDRGTEGRGRLSRVEVFMDLPHRKRNAFANFINVRRGSGGGGGGGEGEAWQKLIAKNMAKKCKICTHTHTQ